MSPHKRGLGPKVKVRWPCPFMEGEGSTRVELAISWSVYFGGQTKGCWTWHNILALAVRALGEGLG